MIKHFVSLEFNRFLDYYGDKADLNSPENQEYRKKEKGRPAEGLASFRLNTGRNSGISPRDIISFVIEATGRKNVEIGRIELFKNYSTIEVEQNATRELLKNSRGMHFHGVYFDVREMKGSNGERYERDQWSGRSERKRSKSRENSGGGEFKRRNRKKRF